VDVRLPSAPEFDSATQQGNAAHLRMELPPVLRAGIEVRPLASDDLRIEAAYVRELWSVQSSIDLTPEGIYLNGVTGLPSPFKVAPISIPRGMVDSNSFRLGAEIAYELFGLRNDLRLGVAYETSAVPEPYVSAFTADADKVIASLGGGIHVDAHWRLDGVVSHAFAGDVTVTPREAAVPRINPVQGNPTLQTAVNGGTYSPNLWVFGAGLEYRL
jgi:long-subunit fatty acid transport protein